MTLDVQVIVDIELAGSKVVWWAVAPGIGNLAVAADSLRELEALAIAAIEDIVEEEHPGEGAAITFTLRSDAPRSAGNEDPGTLELASQPDVPTLAGTDVDDGQRLTRELVAA